MKLISPKIHSWMDYTIGIVLLVIPWLFEFPIEANETLVLVFVGTGIIGYSIMTNYEQGALKLISMKSHLRLDYLSGLVLAASPWLFGFHKVVSVPYVVIGIFHVLIALFTEPVPSPADRQTPRKIRTAKSS